MIIFNDVEAVEPLPVIYIKRLNLISLSDIHLGFEIASSENGVFIPRIQFNKVEEIIREAKRETGAERIILLGDIKHEFSQTGYHEYEEVSRMLKLLSKNFSEILIVRGNHDTYITRITKKYGIDVYDKYREEKYLFIHGHKDIDLSRVKESVILMGHEHPSVALFTDIGVKEKMKVFLYGEYRGKRVVVLPAASYFAEGSDINIIPQNELISPILKKLNIDRFRAIGLLDGERYLHLPEIGKLRRYG